MNISSEQRLFTLEEANSMLPLVRAIVRDIVALSKTVVDRREHLDDLRSRPGKSSSAEYREEVEHIELELVNDVHRLGELLDELRELGVEPKGLTEGLVDFPAMLNGEVVNLCWKYDEPEIKFWHTLEAGFSGRQPLEGLDL